MMRNTVLALAVLALAAGLAAAEEPVWVEVPGLATDIGVGADGTLWIVGSAARGHMVLRWDDGAWVKAPRKNWLRIDVDGDGDAWAISRDGNRLFRWRDGDWLEVPGIAATDIGVGPEGEVFVVGAADDKHRIHQWVDGGWKPYPGTQYRRVTVDPEGNPYAAGAEGRIYRWRVDTWQQLAGFAGDIGAGPNGELYAVGTGAEENSVFRWDEGAWVKMPDSGFVNIDVGPGDTAWATRGEEGRIHRLRR